MDEDKKDKSGTEVAPVNTATNNKPAPRRGSFAAAPWLLVVLLLAAAGYFAWRFVVQHRASRHDYASEIHGLSQKLAGLQQQMAHLKDRDDTLHARLNDGEQVDQSVRAQLLALSQRTQTLEDGVGKLAAQRLSGHDSLALDQAELLLTLGTERFNLFHDVPATIAAYRAADTALQQIYDAAFAPVRESIQTEIAALEGLHASDPVPLIARLDSLRESIAGLPQPESRANETPAPQKTSRLWRVLGSLVMVRHEEKPKAPLELRDAALSRNLVILDLRDAEAAALARNGSRYRGALNAARTQLKTAFDIESPAVTRTLKQIDDLDSAKLEPEPPAGFGSSLKQLRDLRATHALRASTASRPANDSTASQP